MKENKTNKRKIKEKTNAFAKKALLFIFNPRLLLCIGIAWFITNGWSYIMFAVGTWFDIDWMKAVGAAYLAFLWLPVSPEKIVTFGIAIALLKFLFPKDQKTLAVLCQMSEKIKDKMISKKKKKIEKKGENDVDERDTV